MASIQDGQVSEEEVHGGVKILVGGDDDDENVSHYYCQVNQREGCSE